MLESVIVHLPCAEAVGTMMVTNITKIKGILVMVFSPAEIDVIWSLHLQPFLRPPTHFAFILTSCRARFLHPQIRKVQVMLPPTKAHQHSLHPSTLLIGGLGVSVPFPLLSIFCLYYNSFVIHFILCKLLMVYEPELSKNDVIQYNLMLQKLPKIYSNSFTKQER